MATKEQLPEDLIQDNLSRQGEEIEILSSMYDTDFQIEDETPTFSVTVNIAKNDQDDYINDVSKFLEVEKWEATLVVSYHLDYPSSAPPIYHLSVPWLDQEKTNSIYKELDDLSISNLGEPIVYFWVEKLREMLLDLKPLVEVLPPPPVLPARSKLIDVDFVAASADFADDEGIEKNYYENEISNKKSFTSQTKRTVPEIFTGEPLMDRKSTFQAHLAVVHSVEDVKSVLTQLYTNKKIAAATHNMYAYRIDKESVLSSSSAEPGAGQSPLIQIQDCDDDGETHAGGRLLHLLQILDCRNVVVIVSRWYGGIMLHGDRFKHINNVARILLESNGYIRKGHGPDDIKKKSK